MVKYHILSEDGKTMEEGEYHEGHLKAMYTFHKWCKGNRRIL